MIFLESPWPILFLGIVAEAILALMLFRTGRGILLLAMGGVALGVLLGVVIERLVVTERERVAMTIDEAAAAVEANDLPRLLRVVSPTAAATREKAQWALRQARFTQVRVRNLDVNLVKTTSPPTAKATFNAVVTGRDVHGEFGEQTHMAAVWLRLRLESGRWMIFEHGLENRPGNP